MAAVVLPFLSRYVPPPPLVAPVISNQEFVAYTSAVVGYVVAALVLDNVPNPATLTNSITAGNADGAFAIGADLLIRVADVEAYTARGDTVATLTVRTQNSQGFDTASIEITIYSSSLTSISSQTMANRSAAPLSNRYCQMGWMVAINDLVDGFRPVLTLADNARISDAQFDEINIWEIAGSPYRHFVSSFFAPEGVGGLEAVQFRLQKEAGSYTPTAGLGLADITGNSNLVLEISDLRTYLGVLQGTDGNWVADFNAMAAVAANVKVRAQGGIKFSVHVDGEIRDTTTNAKHPHLSVRWYVSAISQPGNPAALAALKVKVKIRNGYLFTSAPTEYRYKVKLKNGADTIFDHAITKSFAAAAVNVSGDRVTISVHDIANGECYLPSNPDTLAGGLSASAHVFARRYDSNAIEFLTSSYRAVTDAAGTASSRVNLTSQGTGTTTLTRYIAQPHQIDKYVADEDAQPFWIGAAKPTMEVAFTTPEKGYWQRAGFLIGQDLTADYGIGPAMKFRNGNNGPFYPAINSGGANSRDNIGQMPAWCIKAFVSMEPGWLNQARIATLIGAEIYLMGVVNEQVVSGEKLFTPLCMNNGPGGTAANGAAYTGLGTPKPNSYWFSNGSRSGDTFANTGSKGSFDESTGPDGSHWPEFAALMAALEGEPWFIDILHDSANRHLISTNSASRTRLLGGLRSWGLQVFLREDQLREEGHCMRGLALSKSFGSSANDPMVPYHRDCEYDSLNYHARKRAATPGMVAIGSWKHNPAQQNGAAGWTGARGFMCAYNSLHAMQVAALTPTDDAQSYAAHGVIFPNALFTGLICDAAGWIADSYTFSQADGANWVTFETMGVTGEDNGSYDFMTADPDGTVHLASSAGAFRGTVFNGMRLRVASQPANTPPELSNTATYYAVEANDVAKTCKLSLTEGGAPIASLTPRANFDLFAQLNGGLPTGGRQGGDAPLPPEAYMAIMRAPIVAAKLLGFNVDEALAEADARMEGVDLTASTGPIWALVATNPVQRAS